MMANLMIYLVTVVGGLLGVVLIYKAFRMCCQCVKRSCCEDRDAEVGTNRAPVLHPFPSIQVVTTRATPRTFHPTLYHEPPYYVPSGIPQPSSAWPTEFLKHESEISNPGTKVSIRTSSRPQQWQVVMPAPPERAHKAVTPTTGTATSLCLCTGVITGIVTWVVDGDGFRLFHSCPGHPALDDTLKIRLAGIDAPEMGKKNTEGQPFSKESKYYLTKLVLRKTLLLEKYGLDQYGRILAMAYLQVPQNSRVLSADTNVNLDMLASGWACVYKGRDAVYGKYEQDFLKAEAEAKRSKRGMWAGNGDIVSPMEYKKQQRACQAQSILVA